MIIGISGKALAGKDTAADFMVMKYGFKKVSLAAPLKDMAMKYFGLTHEQVYNIKDSNTRNILCGLGMAMRGEVSEAFWIHKLATSIDHGSNIVVPDVRMINEVSALKLRGSFVFRINREVTISNGENHATETELDDYLFPAYINNDGSIDDLYGKIDSLMHGLGFEVKNDNTNNS